MILMRKKKKNLQIEIKKLHYYYYNNFVVYFIHKLHVLLHKTPLIVIPQQDSSWRKKRK